MNETSILMVIALGFVGFFYLFRFIYEGERPPIWNLSHRNYFESLKNQILKRGFTEVLASERYNNSWAINKAFHAMKDICKNSNSTRHFILTDSFSILDGYEDPSKKILLALVAQAFVGEDAPKYAHRILFMQQDVPFEHPDLFIYSGSTMDTHFQSDQIQSNTKKLFATLNEYYPYDSLILKVENTLIYMVPFKIESQTLEIVDYLASEGIKLLSPSQ